MYEDEWKVLYIKSVLLCFYYDRLSTIIDKAFAYDRTAIQINAWWQKKFTISQRTRKAEK